MLVLCMLWGVQQVASKVSLQGGFPPITQALLRSVLAGAALLFWIVLRRGWRGLAALAAPGAFWPGLLIAAGFAAEFALLFEGMARIPASRAVVLLYTAVFFTAAGTHVLVPGERLRAPQVVGFLLAFAGVVSAVGGSEGSLAGDLLVLGGAAAWGSTTVVVKASRALHRVSAETVLAYQVLGSIPLLGALAWLKGEASIPDATTLAWELLLYQALVVSFASYLTWFWLIARYPAGRLAAFSFLTPLFGIVAAALLLGEPIGWSLLVGFACVGAGLLQINR